MTMTLRKRDVNGHSNENVNVYKQGDESTSSTNREKRKVKDCVERRSCKKRGGNG